MALKDLIVDSGAVIEAAIEEIISDYVKYEVDPHAIVFTPEGNSLGNSAKIIVYVAAVLGWAYVVDDPPSISTKPVDLEDAVGIKGGSLRPILKQLKDDHILARTDGHYSVRTSNLAAAGQIVRGDRRVQASPPKSVRAKRDNRSIAVDDAAKDEVKPKKKTGVPIKASLEGLLYEGFFGELRTLTRVADRLQELAVNAKMTSLSGPVADLVRGKKLERKKVKENGRQVWAYRTPRA